MMVKKEGATCWKQKSEDKNKMTHDDFLDPNKLNVQKANENRRKWLKQLRDPSMTPGMIINDSSFKTLSEFAHETLKATLLAKKRKRDDAKEHQ